MENTCAVAPVAVSSDYRESVIIVGACEGLYPERVEPSTPLLNAGE
jgi:hypothetical protein